MMTDREAVFSAVRRGYSSLKETSPSEIIEYFSEMDAKEFSGHLSNIKGIVFEEEIAKELNEQGLQVSLFDTTHHPDTDISVVDTGLFFDSDAVEFQLKATDSISYINSTLSDCDDIPIIATSEIASYFEDNPLLIDSGISNKVLSDTVSSVLTDPDSIDAVTDVISDTVSDSLSDIITDNFIPLPFGPVGIIKLLLGIIF